MIKKMFTDFGKNLKNYIAYIMKLGFGDLFVQFLILVIILVLACFIYVPIQLIQDLILNIITVFIEGDSPVITVYEIIFNIIKVACTFIGFVYLFNKRYDDVQKDIKREQEKKMTEDIELPKMK